MGKYCVVKECNNNNKNNPRNVSFHKFPEAVGRLKWTQAIQRNRNDATWKPSKSSVVCSDHFREADLTETASGRRYVAPKKYPTKLYQYDISKAVKTRQPRNVDILTISDAIRPQTLFNFNISHAPPLSLNKQITLNQNPSTSAVPSGSGVNKKIPPVKRKIQTSQKQQGEGSRGKKKTAQEKPIKVQTESSQIVAIMASDRSSISDEELKDLYQRIVRQFRYYLESKTDAGPYFDGSPSFEDGMLIVKCCNDEAKKWLEETVSPITVSRWRSLTVKLLSDVIRVKCGILFRDQNVINVPESQMQEKLQQFNPWASVNKWTFEKPLHRQEGIYFTVNVPNDFLVLVRRRGYRLNYEIGSVILEEIGENSLGE